mmetsp:Transcript_52012/g.123845  ORF Transcript_52012/g.123845 Transcript_52012/m.123845 type:complete len:411 (-) Transcript_52012:67-1299(-)
MSLKFSTRLLCCVASVCLQHTAALHYLSKRADNSSTGIVLHRVHELEELDEMGFNNDDGDTVEKLESKAEDEVVCGGHKAPTCGECTQGNGASWCNGDCVWKDEVCQSRFPDIGPDHPFGCINEDESQAEECRARTGSTHLNFMRPEGAREPAWYYTEIRPTSASAATYFASNTHGYGYAGIQMKTKDPTHGHVALCSIWDQESGGAVIEKCGENADCTGFGGEGTGAKAKLHFEWELGKSYAWMLHRKALEDGRIQHTCWFHAPEYDTLAGSDGWKHIATATSGSNDFGTTFKDSGAFLEQWTHEDSDHLRRGLYGPAYYKDDGGEWAQSRKAKFSAYCLPERVEAQQVTCDHTAAGVDGEHVYMQTGGLQGVDAAAHENRLIDYPEHSSLPEPLAKFSENVDKHLAEA